jgi:hypothetical protein
MFENWDLRKIFGPKGKRWQETGENCTMRSFTVLYFSPHNIRLIKSRWMRWVAHVARMVECRLVYRD